MYLYILVSCQELQLVTGPSATRASRAIYRLVPNAVKVLATAERFDQWCVDVPYEDPRVKVVRYVQFDSACCGL